MFQVMTSPMQNMSIAILKEENFSYNDFFFPFERKMIFGLGHCAARIILMVITGFL